MKCCNRTTRNSTSRLWTMVVILSVSAASALTMSEAELKNRIKGGWVGKHAGVSAGAPTEFKALGVQWTGSINLYPNLGDGSWQDDIYVQVTFLEVMDAKMNGAKGIFTATMKEYGEAFKNTSYDLWGSNDIARNNLRKGIEPPYSGMYVVHGAPDGKVHTANLRNDCIDWQIECDWIGLMCPAMPVTARAISDTVGHIMNYGDGVYGGHWVTSMIALAFKYNDIYTIVTKALENIPRQSFYYQTIKDVVNFYDANPNSTWQECWTFINTKWLNKIPSPNVSGNFSILASFNGAFIAIGLLYGKGDPVKTIEIAIRCGQDSDCNPANAGAVIGVMLGADKLPNQWVSSYDAAGAIKYSYCNYTFGTLLSSSYDRAKKAITQKGGTWANGQVTIAEEQTSQPELFERRGYWWVPNPDYGATGTDKRIAARSAAPRIGVGDGKAVFDIIDNRGRLVRSVSQVQPGQLNTHHQGLPRGAYILRARTAANAHGATVSIVR